MARVIKTSPRCHQTVIGNTDTTRNATSLQRMPLETTLTHPSQAHAAPSHRLVTQWATDDKQILAAKRLRYRVFHDELGAHLSGGQPGLDQDEFDAYCKHLIVSDNHTGEVVGTYRLLEPSAAKAIGCYYADTEFDLTRLRNIKPKMAELGRSCVDPNYRTGAVIMAMWREILRYCVAQGHPYLLGCTTVPMRWDGGMLAHSLWSKLASNHLASEAFQVYPRKALPGLSRYYDAPSPPALMQAYLRMGAKILGKPAWDVDFCAADFPMLLNLENLPRRYQRGLKMLSRDCQ